ncbi:MAG: hypothetical protein EOL87_07720 [Spartobacteria bacterium]|nr:hypothetical protein [Spartobacteria bacterium]
MSKIEEFSDFVNSKIENEAKVSQFKKWLDGKKRTDEERQQGQVLLDAYARKDKAPVPSSVTRSKSITPQHVSTSQGSSNKADNERAGDPGLIGGKFKNPYTFIPFPDQPPVRHAPTPLTIDEIELDRFTGVIDIDVKLCSPLLTNDPVEIAEVDQHKTYRALTIDDHVIVPATGVRGSLRSLMSTLTGGTLGHIDEELWLCQGRDLNLGPASAQSKNKYPDQVFLGQVISPGGIYRDGQIQLGQTQLIKLKELETIALRSGVKLERPGNNVSYLWLDDARSSISRSADARHPWKIKLSGRPIKKDGKREGLFKADGPIVTLPAALWSAYAGRNRHGIRPELKRGDLVWLEPIDLKLNKISTAAQIKSIQWARWGRGGERLLDIIAAAHPHQIPDAYNPDGLVDEVTDLFGQVPREDMVKEVGCFANGDVSDQPGPAGPFVARIRCSNLVFENAKNKCEKEVVLAPLGQPHPGCAAFYRDPKEPNTQKAADKISNSKLPLRGFKVYRNTSERDENAPWKYSVQGVYDETGNLKDPHQKINKTVDLLPETAGIKGRLRLTVRALNARELALLLAACSVDWRLGGGKPLGLGHCYAQSVILRKFEDDGLLHDIAQFTRDDTGSSVLPEPYSGIIQKDKNLCERIELWRASQQQVDKLRYPRAVDENTNGKSRGGHVWFSRHAQPSKGQDEHANAVGLQALHLEGNLKKEADAPRLSAQPLPMLNPDYPGNDDLFGYDLFAGEGEEWFIKQKNNERHYKKFEPFDPVKHARSSDKSGGNTSQNRNSRQQRRDRR